MIRSAAALLALLSASPVTSEKVDVRGRGQVDLAGYACTDTPRSTVVQRICYDEAQRSLLVAAGGAYFEHCHLPTTTFEAFAVAPSMGQYYRRLIAGSDRFSCDATN